MSIIHASAQATAKDSIALIEQERIELELMQRRIREKQDSLVRERVKINEEQKRIEAAKRVEATRNNPAPLQSANAPTPIIISKRKVKNVVGFAPVQMLITGFDLFYERVIGEKTSIVLSGGYHGMENFPRQNSSGAGYSNSSTTLGTAFLGGDKVANYGVRVQVQLRAYLFEEVEVLEKLYIAPTFLYKHDEMVRLNNRYALNNSVSPEYNHYFAEAVVPGLDIGYQIKVLRYFTVNPFIGFMYTVPITGKDDANEVNIDFLNPYRQNLMVRTGLTIGFTF
ncbi:MAG: hypothetical protein H7282_07700 [Cytophagaceae bacterium]|nr:hypothetical protein [Cytophagaceae bacterium]